MENYCYTPWIYRMSKISADDVKAIAHINHITHTTHDLVDEIYEDLMDREHLQAKLKAKNVVKIMTELIQSLTDEI